MIPTDVLRRPPASFEEWSRSFEVLEKEDQEKLSLGAIRLLKDPVLRHVLAKVERDAVAIIVSAPVTDTDRVMIAKSSLMGLRGIRTMLSAMAQDEAFNRKSPNPR